MPKQLYDGFGNVVTAYTQAEVDAIKANLESENGILRKNVLELEIENKKLKTKRSRKKGGSAPV